MASLMRPFVAPGEVVLDPFLGSGTTGAAALGLGCTFVGCDIEAGHVEVAASRLAEAADDARAALALFPGQRPPDGRGRRAVLPRQRPKAHAGLPVRSQPPHLALGQGRGSTCNGWRRER